MSERIFFATFPEIAKKSPQLEELLSSPKIKQEGDRLFFRYWAGMDDGFIQMQIVADETGSFWIAKPNEELNLVYEEFGSNASRYLGLPSPEVDSITLLGKRYILSAFVQNSREPTEEELAVKGDGVIVPRLLAARIRAEKRGNGSETIEASLDLAMRQFVINGNGVLYQLDFSPYPEKAFPLAEVKAQLAKLGLPADPSNETVSRQLQLLKHENFPDMYARFTATSAKAFPEGTARLQKRFQWNYDNIGRVIELIHESRPERSRSYRVILA